MRINSCAGLINTHSFSSYFSCFTLIFGKYFFRARVSDAIDIQVKLLTWTTNHNLNEQAETGLGLYCFLIVSVSFSSVCKLTEMHQESVYQDQIVWLNCPFVKNKRAERLFTKLSLKAGDRKSFSKWLPIKRIFSCI